MRSSPKVASKDRLTSLAQRLRHLRSRENLSQAELAEMAKLPTRTLSNWEAGTREPGLFGILALAKALKISIEELAGS